MVGVDVPTVSLDQHHWVGLARVLKRRGGDPTYRAILEVGTELRSRGLVRFPLSTDRYHETLRVPAHQRVDLASVMAALSGYETLLNLDTLTTAEIDAALCWLDPRRLPPDPIPVFGDGCLHAFGRQPLADSLRIIGPVDELGVSADQLVFLTEQMRAVVRESWARQFEWSVLSGDPRVHPLDPSLRRRYDDARAEFAAEEQRRLALVHSHGWDPRKAAYFYAFELHAAEIAKRSLATGVDLGLAPLDTDPFGFIETIPTMHVLAELLAHQYRNPATTWSATDWADMRTLCAAVPYCTAVAPDRKWAAAVSGTRLDHCYETSVLRNSAELLRFLHALPQA
jgi:hypothetical protein